MAAPARDILELQNVNAVYERLPELGPKKLKDFLKAHRILMKGLIPSAGRWRAGGVAITKGDKIAHAAPPADRVNRLMKDHASLFPNISSATASRDLRHGADLGRLIKSREKALTRYRVGK